MAFRLREGVTRSTCQEVIKGHTIVVTCGRIRSSALEHSPGRTLGFETWQSYMMKC